MKTELIHNMPYDEYAAKEGLNASSLKVGATGGMALMRHYIMHGRPDTDAMAFGRMVHTAILEPEKILSRLVVWEGGDKRKAKAEWAAFREANKSKEIVELAQRDALEQISIEVRNNPKARDLIDEAAHEVSLFWQHKYLGNCKARADLLGINCGLCDIKTTRADNAIQFASQCAQKAYDVQLGWYINGIAGLECYSPDLPVSVIAIRNKAPFCVSVLRVPQQVIDDGQDKALEIAANYRACASLGKYEWIGNGDLVWPEWASKAQALDMTGLEEDSGNE